MNLKAMTKVKDTKLLNCDRPRQCNIWTAHDVGMILQTYGDLLYVDHIYIIVS